MNLLAPGAFTRTLCATAHHVNHAGVVLGHRHSDDPSAPSTLVSQYGIKGCRCWSQDILIPGSLCPGLFSEGQEAMKLLTQLLCLALAVTWAQW